MESLRSLFFEDPTFVYIALGLAMLVLAAMWHERRSGLLKRLLLVPPLLAVVVFAVAHFVVTDREQILRIAHRIAEDVQTGAAEDIPQFLDEGFTARLHGRALVREDIEEAVKEERETYNIADVHVADARVDVAGDRASMVVSTTITFQSSGLNSAVMMQWEISWIKRPEGWRIRSVKEPKFGM